MTTVLVVDDDPLARAAVREAAPQGWTLVEAGDGLSGLDVVRRQRHDLQLIVLDVGMPMIDGRVICARIRDVDQQVPILPFTAMGQAVHVLNAFGCLPPVLKPVRPHDLARALRAALAQTPPPLQEGALIGWAYEQSQLVEHLVRQNLAAPRVVVYASSPVRRAGLAHMAGASSQVVEAAHGHALRHLLAGMRWTAILTDALDVTAAAPLAREHELPLIVIAGTTVQAQASVGRDGILVLVETDPSLEQRLGGALAAIANGESLSQWSVTPTAASRGVVPPLVARQFAQSPVSARELEVLWLDYHGYELAEIARTLAIDTSTVTSHWKRVQRKLQRDRQEVRAWVREQMRADEAGR